MKGFVKYTLFLLLPIVLIILWLSGVFHPKIHAEEVERPVKYVSGLEVEKVKVIKEVPVSYLGTVIATDRAEVSSRVMGYIVKEFVKEGDYVKKGKTLYVIDPRDIQAQTNIYKQRIYQAKKNYLAAKANFEAVKKTYERFKKLLKEGAVTQQEFDQVEAKFKAAKAQLEAAKAEIEVAKQAYKASLAQLSYVKIKAPFSGYVVKKIADKGDIARPGMPLLILERPPYKVEVALPERLYGKVKVGNELVVRIDTLNKTFKGKVVEVEGAVDPRSRTFKIKVLIGNEKLKSGIQAKVFLIEKLTEPTILIPSKAVYKRWDFTGVWVVKPDNTLELRLVRLGREFDGYYEVLSGLSQDERIVVEGIEKACEGCKIGG